MLHYFALDDIASDDDNILRIALAPTSIIPDDDITRDDNLSPDDDSTIFLPILYCSGVFLLCLLSGFY